MDSADNVLVPLGDLGISDADHREDLLVQQMLGLITAAIENMDEDTLDFMHHIRTQIAVLGRRSRELSTILEKAGQSGEISVLASEAKALWEQYQIPHSLEDLNAYLSNVERLAFGLTEEDGEYAAVYSNWGAALLKRFGLTGTPEDIETATILASIAVAATPDGDPERPTYLNNFGSALMTRFNRVGNLEDLEHSISASRDAVDLTPDGHPDRPGRLSNLGIALVTRFNRLGNLEDLEQSILAMRDAVDLTPDGHPRKSAHLSNLGSALGTRFGRLNNLEDLDQAISANRDAVNLTPDGHPSRPMYLNNLGNVWVARFDRLGNLEDLEQAISTKRDAVNLTPDGHPDRPMNLSNLGNVLETRFDRLGNLEDLNQAISVMQDAVDLTPYGHPDRPGRLSNLGNVLETRFNWLGNLEDLNQAISVKRDAVNLTPDGHPGGPMNLSNLGNALGTRFGRLDNLEDLDQAVSANRDAVSLTPDGHPDRSMYLNNLGNVWMARFDRLGNLEDLEQAISAMRDTVSLTPDGHPDKPVRLNNLGNSLGTRFRRLGNVEDLDQAISANRDAVKLTPDGHPRKPTCLSNIGNALATRFERLGNLDDLNQAISATQNAIKLTPDGHPQKSARLSNVGDALGIRFDLLGNLNDLNQAVSATQNAVDLMPDGHPDTPGCLNSLSIIMLKRYLHSRNGEDLHTVMLLLRSSATSHSGLPRERFQSARAWGKIAALFGDLSSATEAFKALFALLPQIVWLGGTVSKRYNDIVVIGDAVSRAVVVAIRAGELQLALEWLEEGRSIVWGQTLKLRTPMDALRAAHPELGRKLEKISGALDHASIPAGSEAIHAYEHSLESQAQAHRRLAENWERTVEETRRMPGFEDFLCPSKFSKLSEVSQHGLIVCLSTHEEGCDALVLPYGSDDIVPIPLPNLTYAKAVALRAKMTGSLSDAHVRTRASRQSIPGDMELVLSVLWSNVVKPVFEALGLRYPTTETPFDLPQVFWCASGPLASMPLHAAGDYSQIGLEHRAYGFAVSSYIPTLASLLRASENLDDDFNGILAVSESSTLPGTIREIDAVVKQVGSGMVTHLNSNYGTKSAVLDGMAGRSWVHLACHGIQNQGDPLKSSFKLHDGNLELSDIMQKSFRHGGLAFLSACQTATGHDDLPDEAIHLAAGMLSAGYSSVVGTMWSIQDDDAPLVAGEFYTRVIDKDNGTGDVRKSAWALHEATRKLREKVGEKHFVRWVPFIHMGL